MSYEKKRVFVIKTSRFGEKIYCTSKEKAFKLFSLLGEEEFFTVEQIQASDNYEEKFKWPKRYQFGLEIQMVNLFKTKEEAQLSCSNYDKAYKMKLIKKKKKKTP